MKMMMMTLKWMIELLRNIYSKLKINKNHFLISIFILFLNRIKLFYFFLYFLPKDYNFFAIYLPSLFNLSNFHHFVCFIVFFLYLQLITRNLFCFFVFKLKFTLNGFHYIYDSELTSSFKFQERELTVLYYSTYTGGVN